MSDEDETVNPPLNEPPIPSTPAAPPIDENEEGEIDDDDDDDEEEEEDVSADLISPPPPTSEPVVDVLQIDNELSSTKYRFKKNEIMLCFHGLLLYEVKCVDHKMKENDSGNFHRPIYLVHYCGWSSKWDEWVDESRLVKMDDGGLKKQAELLAQHGKGKARLKNLRKSHLSSPSKRTTSRSISDYSTGTNVDSVITEATHSNAGAPVTTTVTAGSSANNPFTAEETRSLSGRSDTGSSSSSSSTTSELISQTTDSTMVNNDLMEPELKKFKRSGKSTSKEKSQSSARRLELDPIADLSPNLLAQHETCQRLTRRFYTCQMEWLQFPSDLVEFLINDRDLVNNQNHLLTIPPADPSFTIRQIFKTYLDQQINECSLAEVLAIQTLISSLMDMFNIALGKCLLYRFERLQLRQLLEKDNSISLCDYYGSIHLLRFFWRIKDFLKEMNVTSNREEFGLLLGRIQHFLHYLDENRTTLFHSSDYDICSTEYYRCSLQCFQ